MSNRGTEDFAALATRVNAAHNTAPEEEKLAFRRAFMFAISAGILQAINTEAPVVVPEHVALRDRIRDRMREQQAEHTGQTALEALRAGQEILVEEYRAIAAINPEYAPESEIAYNTQCWGKSDDMVDEAFATEVLDFIKL